MSETEPEPQRSLKKLTWQSENCLACVWFHPNDPINADMLERGKCVHSKLKTYDLIVSGRDWCNLFTEIRQKAIDLLQEKAMKVEESEKWKHQTCIVRGSVFFAGTKRLPQLYALFNQPGTVRWCPRNAGSDSGARTESPRMK